MDTNHNEINENPRKHISTIGLRKYFDNDEKWHYGWTRTIPYYCHKNKDNFNYQKKMENSHQLNMNGLKFQHVPKFLYTNNPCIRRNVDYYQCGAIPIPEFADININKKDWTDQQSCKVPYWGFAEAITMEKTIDLITYYLEEGIFGHYEDWQEAINKSNNN